MNCDVDFSQKKNWYASVYNKIHFDMHAPAEVHNVGRDFDANEFVAMLVKAGVEAVCFFAKCGYGWSYYPTKIGHQHPSLKRDLLGEVVEACHDKDIRVIAYYHLMGAEWAVREHPEWLYLTKDGTVIKTNELCWNTPAVDELIIPQLLEIVTEYPVDGLWLDAPMRYPCYSSSCLDAYRRAGGEIQQHSEEDYWRYWLWWRKNVRNPVIDLLIKEIHSARADILICINGESSNVDYPSTTRPDIDYLSADTPLLCGDLNAWITRGLPFDVMTTRMIGGWGDGATKPVATIEQEVAHILANGGRLFLADHPYYESAMPDPEVMKIIGEAFAFARKIEPWIKDAEPVPYVAILDSSLSRNPRCLTDYSHIAGAYVALLQEGIYTHILHEDQIESLLPKYQVLVMPEQICLSSKTVEAIRRFVYMGGGLVAIGGTAMIDNWEETPRASKLSDVLGVSLNGFLDKETSYFRLSSEWSEVLRMYGDALPPIQVRGIPARASITTAQKISSIIFPNPFGQPWFWSGSREETEFVALSINEYGKGTVVFVAPPITRDFFEGNFRNISVRHVLTRIVEKVAQRRILTVNSDATLEATVFRRENSIIVHLVNLVNYNFTRSFSVVPSDKIPTISDVTVHLYLRSPCKKVTQQPEGKQLKWEQKECVLTIKVPKIRIHTCIVVDL